MGDERGMQNSYMSRAPLSYFSSLCPTHSLLYLLSYSHTHMHILSSTSCHVCILRAMQKTRPQRHWWLRAPCWGWRHNKTSGTNFSKVLLGKQKQICQGNILKGDCLCEKSYQLYAWINLHQVVESCSLVGKKGENVRSDFRRINCKRGLGITFSSLSLV